MRVVVPPGVVLADDKDSEDCASAKLQVVTIRAVTRNCKLAITDLGIEMVLR